MSPLIFYRKVTFLGDIILHDFISNNYCVLLFHPADYTPVSTSELGRIAADETKFNHLGTKLLSLSVDTVESHMGWIQDIKDYSKLNGKASCLAVL